MIPVAGGLAGGLLGPFIHALRISDHLASYVLNPCYWGLARSGLFRVLLPPALRPKVITFEREGAAGDATRHGKASGGRRPAGAGAWIDPAALPDLRGRAGPAVTGTHDAVPPFLSPSSPIRA